MHVLLELVVHVELFLLYARVFLYVLAVCMRAITWQQMVWKQVKIRRKEGEVGVSPVERL